MTPPMAIIVRCRCLSPLCSSGAPLMTGPPCRRSSDLAYHSLQRRSVKGHPYSARHDGDRRRPRCAAAERFGLVPAEIVPLPGERTLNALVSTAAGDAVVVKLHPPDEAPDVDLEVAALDALAHGPAAALVPRVVRTPAGEHRAEVGGRIGRALTWLPGSVWAEVGPATPERLRSLGAAVARVDAALAGFTTRTSPGPCAGTWPPRPASASCSPT